MSQSLPSMTGKTCVITGATSGIGKEAAKALAALGANLVLVGRSERAGADIARRLRTRSRSAIEFIKADLSVQSQVRQLASAIRNQHERVDVLLNNAGARYDVYQESAEGIELTFATNHLSHFLLTGLLLDTLKSASAARVITVASGAHRAALASGKWTLTRANYDRRQSYAKSKLANVLFGYELARRLVGTGITSNVADPGGVASNFARNNGWVPWIRHLVAHGITRQLITSKTGAKGFVYLAASEELAGMTGSYFYRGREARSSEASHDADAAKGLWTLSVQLTGVDYPRLPLRVAKV